MVLKILQYLLENNEWPWSDEVKKMYRDAIAQSSFISVNLSSSLGEAQAIYNQTAIKELLSWNSKEGTFLLHGATIELLQLPEATTEFNHLPTDRSRKWTKTIELEWTGGHYEPVRS